MPRYARLETCSQPCVAGDDAISRHSTTHPSACVRALLRAWAGPHPTTGPHPHDPFGHNYFGVHSRSSLATASGPFPGHTETCVLHHPFFFPFSPFILPPPFSILLASPPAQRVRPSVHDSRHRRAGQHANHVVLHLPIARQHLALYSSSSVRNMTEQPCAGTAGGGNRRQTNSRSQALARGINYRAHRT